MKTLAKKDDSYYSDLVNQFMTESKLSDVDPMEKKKFLTLCVINKLNPFKNQVYAIPRNSKQKDWTWKKILTITIAYTTFLERAEDSWMLSGWNVIIKKENGKVMGWKITIYRKDWNHPFEYEADIADMINADNSIWNSKPEAMVRKQLIRIWFSLAFPENCATLDVESRQIEEQAIVVEETITPEVLEAKPIESQPWEAEKTDEKNTPAEDWRPTTEGKPISNDQMWAINKLSAYFPEWSVVVPDTYDEATIMIRSMKQEIGKKFIREKSIELSEIQVLQIFAWEDAEIKKIKAAALKLIKEKSKDK